MHLSGLGRVLFLSQQTIPNQFQEKKTILEYQPPGGKTPHMKGVGMLVVSLRGVNFGFWSHLGPVYIKVGDPR